jgi:CarD family transcriptional regulator
MQGRREPVERTVENREKRLFFGHFSLIGHQNCVILKGLLAPLEPSIPCFLTGGTVTFEVGDKVIYPNHGLGIVERIEEKTILGTTLANVDGVGLRRAISDEEVERLFGLLGDGQIDNHQNWKGRFKDNSDKMRSGSIYEVADVLKSLTFLAKSKSLSFREKRMLDRAKFLIVSEVSEVMRETAPAIEARVDRALERCFSVKARTAPRAKVAKAAPRTVPAPTAAAPPQRRAARAS